MSADRRTRRDERRRRLGQNFLKPDVAGSIVDDAGFRSGELVVEVGAGAGAFTFALARHGVEVVAIEKDPHWAGHLRSEASRRGLDNVRIVCRDLLDFRMPRGRPYRVVGSLPFGATTAVLRHLFDLGASAGAGANGNGLTRADLVVQWEVARKRAATPPTTLLSTTWAPWWCFDVVRRIPASSFRPVPAVDAGVLRVTRRRPPLLPEQMADAYADFVRREWK